jgi:hypothetical protein
MDSIVIMDKKWILFIKIVTKIKGHIKREKHEETKPQMYIVILKHN